MLNKFRAQPVTQFTMLFSELIQMRLQRFAAVWIQTLGVYPRQRPADHLAATSPAGDVISEIFQPAKPMPKLLHVTNARRICLRVIEHTKDHMRPGNHRLDIHEP